VIATVFLAVCAIADPRVTAPISRDDVKQIVAVVRAATPEPILSIDPVYTKEPRPGAIPQKATELGPISAGKVQNKSIVTYIPTDQVSVRTGSERNLKGGSYKLQRVDRTWKIVFRSSWIH
jgi:hypothetical protein